MLSSDIKQVLEDGLTLRVLIDGALKENFDSTKLSDAALSNISAACDKYSYDIRGSEVVFRKRKIIVRLIMSALKCVPRSVFWKSDESASEKVYTYLAYPSMLDPKILISLPRKYSKKNVPYVFSSIGFINRLHLNLVAFIGQYSKSYADQERLFSDAGIGVIGVTPRELSPQKAFPELEPKSFGELIVLSKEKNIYFMSFKEVPGLLVLSWDNSERPSQQFLAHKGNRFERFVFNGFIRKRRLHVAKFFRGPPLQYSKVNFRRTIGEIFKIQASTTREDLDLSRVWKLNIENLSITLGWSLDQSRVFEKEANRLFVSCLSANRLKRLHGDCVPRNIIANSTGDVTFIDGSYNLEFGFFLTDIATLIVSFLAGEPAKSDVKILESRRSRRRFEFMKAIVIKQYNLTDAQFDFALLIGLCEKVALSNLEGRADIAGYWVELTKTMLLIYLKIDSSSWELMPGDH